MRLLLICSDDENSVDEILVVVPDDYDAMQVLQQAEENLSGSCSIERDVEIDDQAKYGFSTFRMYVG